MRAFVAFFALLALSSAVPSQYARQQGQDCRNIYDLGGLDYVSLCVDTPDSKCVNILLRMRGSYWIQPTGNHCYKERVGLAPALDADNPQQKCEYIQRLGGFETIIVCADTPDSNCIKLDMSIRGSCRCMFQPTGNICNTVG